MGDSLSVAPTRMNLRYPVTGMDFPLVPAPKKTDQTTAPLMTAGIGDAVFAGLFEYLKDKLVNILVAGAALWLVWSAIPPKYRNRIKLIGAACLGLYLLVGRSACTMLAEIPGLKSIIPAAATKDPLVELEKSAERICKLKAKSEELRAEYMGCLQEKGSAVECANKKSRSTAAERKLKEERANFFVLQQKVAAKNRDEHIPADGYVNTCR